MKITKIISVVDTRQREEINDRFVPISGSGHENQCFRCGKLHEIHATVLLDDGSQVVVGIGCAAKENAEIAAKIKSLESAAKRLAKLKAQKAAFETERLKWEISFASVCAMPIPALLDGFDTFKVGMNAGAQFPTISCGDATIPCWHGGRNAEREKCVVEVWRSNRMRELGLNNRPHAIKNFAKEISKIERVMQ